MCRGSWFLFYSKRKRLHHFKDMLPELFIKHLMDSMIRKEVMVSVKCHHLVTIFSINYQQTSKESCY
ncbi:hypothetical protein Pint_30234 [Pistacia integerrima]|uniref:Uncharacterized protein n=1 Tax=Pistacia integerrima TaxID=434235 RepID=A0ACC0X0F7_9ROSI|nr:hypothetical protein Pint_30234 [Pistacia integerrima]